MKELLPCPCCGGEARFIECGEDDHFVKCDNCELQTECDIKDCAADVWNNRVGE